MARRKDTVDSPNEPLASSKARTLLLPLLLFTVGLTVRCIGLQWGLPNATHWYSYHPDELQTFLAAGVNLSFINGDFNPDFFNYPSLYLYLTHLAHLFASGLDLLPAPPRAGTAPFPYVEMHNVLLAGRFMTAILGAATIPLVYAIGRTLGDDRVACLGALLLAFLPGHVQHSHFATVDVSATFFVTLALWLAIKSLQPAAEGNSHWAHCLYASALVAGLAGATKYNAGLIAVAPLAAVVVMWRRQATPLEAPQAVGLAAKVIALTFAGFFIGCPFSLIGPTQFLGDRQNNGFLYEMLVHPRQGSGEVFAETGIGWWYHLSFNLPFLCGLAVFLCALSGVVVMLFGLKRSAHDDESAPARIAAWPLLIWCGFYLFTLGFSQVRFMRYDIPLAPALCILAATAVYWQCVVPRARSASLTVAAVVAGFSLVGTVNVLYPFVSVDPRDAAAREFRAQAATGATVGLVDVPRNWSPPLVPRDQPFGTGVSLEDIENSDPGHRYRFMNTEWNLEKLRSQDAEWFVLSEFDWREKARLGSTEYQSFMKELDMRYELKVQWKNHPPLELPGRSFEPHDFLYTNPEIRLYRRRGGR